MQKRFILNIRPFLLHLNQSKLLFKNILFLSEHLPKSLVICLKFESALFIKSSYIRIMKSFPLSIETSFKMYATTINQNDFSYFAWLETTKLLIPESSVTIHDRISTVRLITLIDRNLEKPPPSICQILSIYIPSRTQYCRISVKCRFQLALF